MSTRQPGPYLVEPNRESRFSSAKFFRASAKSRFGLGAEKRFLEENTQLHWSQMSYSRALMMNYWGAAENPRREEARREENTYYLTTRDLQYRLEA